MVATTEEAAQSDSRIVTVALSRNLNDPIDTLFQVFTCGAPVVAYSGAGSRMKEPQR